MALDGFPQRERQGVLDLLNPVDALGAHDQAVVDGIAHRHAGSLVPAEADREEAPARRLLEGAQHVRRVAARGEADGHVELAGVGDDLAREDELEPHVVGERGEDGLVVDQREGGQRAPVRGVAEQLAVPWASVALPPLPKLNSLPPRAKRSAMAAPARSTCSAQRSSVAARRRPTPGSFPGPT